MRRWFSILLLGGIFLSTCGFRTASVSASTTLEISVRLINVTGGAASFAGPAADAKVEVFNQVDGQLIDSVATDADGLAELPIDPSVALSAYGEYHLSVAIMDLKTGEVVCKPGEVCRVTAYQVNGLSGEEDDGILVVRVLRSPGLVDPVPGITVIARIADSTGYPGYRIDAYTQEKIFDDPGITCTSDAEGWCVFYISPSFRWLYRTVDGLSGNVALEVSKEIGVDGMGIPALESQVTVWYVAVNDKDKLDDCSFKTPPESTNTTKGCKDKRNQVATAQALATVETGHQELINHAIIQSDRDSRETTDLFSQSPMPSIQIDSLLANPPSSFDPEEQVKVILHLRMALSDGYNASIKRVSANTLAVVTDPDDPSRVLGACQSNNLDECVVVIPKASLLKEDGLLKYRVLLDGYDNGIFVCEAGPYCEDWAYTPVGLTGGNDAMVLLILRQSDNLSLPVQGITLQGLITDAAGIPNSIWTYRFGPFEGYDKNIRVYVRSCISDDNGACPIYVDDKEYIWGIDASGVNVGNLAIGIGMTPVNDTSNIRVQDDRMLVMHLAINPSGRFSDCTFTSPFNAIKASTECNQKKTILQTEMASYTATPTVTNTPLATMTPTATEVPPTPTITLTPTPPPGLFAEGKNAVTIAGGAALLVVFLGGGMVLIMRSNRRQKGEGRKNDEQK